MFDRKIPYNTLPDLPPKIDLESRELLKASIKASRLLAELKGYCQTLPNPEILINTVILQESKDSSEIENIVTTQDELYKAILSPDDISQMSAATKEVLNYKEAIYHGLNLMNSRGFTTNTMVSVMQTLKNTTADVRRGTGTRLANPLTKEIIYTPPEGESLLRSKLAMLEAFIHNEDETIDPLIKMALIHYQFEAIHPFDDGNGRTGRIMNVLYLVKMDLLPLPLLYLSSFIIHNKSEYYTLLREVTEKGNWIGWILYMLEAIAFTAALSLKKIKEIHLLKENIIEKAKNILGTSYKRDLVDLLFCHPYVKIKTLEDNNIGHRQTASTYLKKLAKGGVLQALKIGKEWYYINQELIRIVST